MKPVRTPLSRREFAKRAALGTAAAIAPPLSSLASSERSDSADAQAPSNTPKISPQSQAEAEARYQAILSQYPDRFSDAQKTDLKRLCFVLQPQLDRLRAWPIANSDAPALYLRPLIEREKKSNAPPNLRSAPAAAKADTPAKPEASAKPHSSEKR
jgi:hypothetical protein